MSGRGRGGGGARGGGGRGEKTQYDESEEVEFTVSNDVDVVPDFEAMGLRQELLRGIYDYGACFVRGMRLCFLSAIRAMGALQLPLPLPLPRPLLARPFMRRIPSYVYVYISAPQASRSRRRSSSARWCPSSRATT